MHAQYPVTGQETDMYARLTYNKLPKSSFRHMLGRQRATFAACYCTYKPLTRLSKLNYIFIHNRTVQMERQLFQVQQKENSEMILKIEMGTNNI